MNKRGSILVISYSIVFVLAILGAALILRIMNENLVSIRYAGSEKAFWLAEAGVHRAMWELNYNNCGGFIQCDSDPPVSCTDCSCANADKCLSATLGTSGDYDIRINIGNTAVVSTGAFPNRTSTGRFQRTVQTTISRNVTFSNYAAYLDTFIHMGNGSVIDSYNSVLGDYGGGNIGDNAEVATNNYPVYYPEEPPTVNLSNCTIRGNLSIGSGGGIVNIDETAQITGEVTYNNPNVLLPEITVPSDLQSLPNGGVYTINNEQQSLAAGDYQFSSLQVLNGGELTINGEVRIYLTEYNQSALKVEGGASPSQINLAPGASLTIYAEGRFELENGKINASTKNTKKFSLYTNAGSRPNRPYMSAMTYYSELYGTIISPQGEIWIAWASDLYGSFVGAAATINDNNTGLHYDEALKSTPTPGAPDYLIYDWAELNQ
ncbi:MAG: DUF7305 domain-containing protein [Candidatus Omnitrophota bacterium]